MGFEGKREVIDMRLSSSDWRTLRRAADIAEAQSELVELTKSRSGEFEQEETWMTNPAALVAIAAVFVLSVLTLTSLA